MATRFTGSNLVGQRRLARRGARRRQAGKMPQALRVEQRRQEEGVGLLPGALRGERERRERWGPGNFDQGALAVSGGARERDGDREVERWVWARSRIMRGSAGPLPWAALVAG